MGFRNNEMSPENIQYGYNMISNTIISNGFLNIYVFKVITCFFQIIAWRDDSYKSETSFENIENTGMRHNHIAVMGLGDTFIIILPKLWKRAAGSIET